MCWITFKPLKAEVAKKDIKVLKVLYIHPSEPTVLIPYFYSGMCEYSINGENPIIPIIVKEYPNCRAHIEHCAICEGYHSYAVNCPVRDVTPTATAICVNGHYFFNEWTGRQVHLVECIIPKGTTYYLNEFNEYVSERIILKKIIGKTY